MSDGFTSGDIAAAAGESSSPSPETSAPVSTSDAPVSSPERAIAAPGGSDDDDTVPESGGPIPLQRVQRILENARRKSEAAAEARVRESYKWTEGWDEQRASRLAQLESLFQSDPVGLHTRLTQALLNNPQYRQALQPPAPPQLPQPTVRTDTGVPLYDAEAIKTLMEHQANALRQEFQRSVQPLQQSHQYAQAQAQADTTAQRMIQQAEADYPEFKDPAIKSEVHKLMAADKRFSFEGAINKVVLGKMREVTRKSVLEELKQKPAASTAAPSRASGSVPVNDRDRDFAEILAELSASAGR